MTLFEQMNARLAENQVEISNLQVREARARAESAEHIAARERITLTIYEINLDDMRKSRGEVMS